MNNLTPQQNIFSQQVASGKTYAESYRIAYPKSVKWKDESVWCESSKLMSIPMVLQRVKELQSASMKRNEATLDEVLQEMANWLRFNLKTIFNEDGTMKQINEMTDQESACIASYENVELFGNNGDGRTQIGWIRKVKLIDKRATADMFMKKFGQYVENHKVVIEDLAHIQALLDGIGK